MTPPGKLVLIVTAFPVRDGEDLDRLASAARDAVVGAVGWRDNEGFQVAAVVSSDHDAETIAKRAVREAC